MKTFQQILTEEQESDPRFRAYWQRRAPAREFAIALLRYRAEHGLSQRALAKELGISQPRVAKLESGEHNPSVETIINAVRCLGIEFAIDIAPAGRRPALLSASARENEAVAHDEVAVRAVSVSAL
ncbi:MAG TPA: helix-turn-helix transcriptional regulator [Solirubrobacterales bacterium]|nr:helix-turn-helix transcriptional regulator [Solirubrobacterales bacterium]